MSKVFTTDDELQCFYIVKSLLADSIPLSKITYKDTERYFNIRFENNTRKWICRIYIGEKVKNLTTKNTNAETIVTPFVELEDLYNHKDILLESLCRFI